MLMDTLPDQETEALKLPPHSIEAEQSVLGGVLLDNQAWDTVAEQLTEDDFYRRNHRLIFRAMAQLISQQMPLDIITLSEELESRAELEHAGGLVYLGELVQNTPSTANIRAYAEIVRDRSLLRQLIGISGEIMDLAYHPEGRTGPEVLNEAEAKVFKIAESRTQAAGPVGVNPILAQTIERIDLLNQQGGEMTGASTGFSDLDRMTSGMQPSDMIIVAARPSMGKTTFAMNVVQNVVVQGNKPVLVFSLEMPAEQLMMRMLASLGKIPLGNVRTGQMDPEEWTRLTGAVHMLRNKPLYIDDQPGLTPSEMRARARRIHREHGSMGLIMVDYLQLMRLGGNVESRTQEVAEISRSLKALAKELHCPVIALSQLNRSLENRPNKRPINSDLRESGSIEQDADVIMFIYRDEVYNEDSPDKGVAEIIIGKQRNGPIGTCRLAFIGKYTRFEDLAREIYDSYKDEY
ncbi:replicative DNA helicase [Pokkaliibacter sp. MBI-7]|uniref:Replicative DNA helicase n=1 Tax=Proteobacteria bacterium 228 TaxID=2083153 RepID=A0A2S5KJ45_9PROT|nr:MULTISPECIES: replicative DNA helicase [Pokkaliibacter]MDH2432199.1 replicative DNA helicase [Pokkaliibacter sp. MBI-7]PPC74396.1 replicative DNA helicase [Pokkaliibacter plantistimulans]